MRFTFRAQRTGSQIRPVFILDVPTTMTMEQLIGWTRHFSLANLGTERVEFVSVFRKGMDDARFSEVCQNAVKRREIRVSPGHEKRFELFRIKGIRFGQDFQKLLPLGGRTESSRSYDRVYFHRKIFCSICIKLLLQIYAIVELVFHIEKYAIHISMLLGTFHRKGP